MGLFIYDDARRAEFEDRTLAHLQVVILNKLRRQESFVFSWEETRGFVSVWLHRGVAIQFVYLTNRDLPMNRAWLELLAESANSTVGLLPLPEPPPPVVE